ncbi:nucleotide pyrophosphohydrolase [Methylophaga sulfidovorans]|uniref:NTP pyrophosphatase, house-cleaning of non-canonical NTPs n=1 Tax=Methylophaga sulfidovorans TaxID=45496 RepID=A0A1I3V8C3_9GAMM|nr:nucleotide pyrophosphohydrolase [Methylophaga sulfidovorans]SFJ90616.1 NTP pyrophosphatase, house-cleaning of non-canonical NTPs [Methylophaga sulfidovorans]
MIEPELLRQLIAFRRERDWEQFHNPKDVAISLSIEASELLEWFQWKSAEEVQQRLASDKREDLEDEIADVAVYLFYLCHDLNIDLNQVIKHKMQKNAAKYPRDKVKGRNDKYDEYS